MEFPFTAQEVLIGVIGIGYIYKGLVEHWSTKKSGPCPQSFECKADHAGLRGWMDLEFERVNMKLDSLMKEK